MTASQINVGGPVTQYEGMVVLRGCAFVGWGDAGRFVVVGLFRFVCQSLGVLSKSIQLATVSAGTFLLQGTRVGGDANLVVDLGPESVRHVSCAPLVIVEDHSSQLRVDVFPPRSLARMFAVGVSLLGS